MNLAENYPIEMRSLLKRMIELYGKADAKTIADALPDFYVGKVFMPKGTVATVADLPDEGNEIGDMYHVTEDEGEYAWWPTTEYPNGHWEFMGSVSGSSDLFIVTVDTETTPYTADKTVSEVASAYEAGKDIRYCVKGFLSARVAKETGIGGNQYVGNVIFSDSTITPMSVYAATVVYTDDILAVQPLSLTNVVEYEKKPITTAVSGSTPTIAAADNTIYECGECTSLTVSSFPASGEFLIVFASGSTPTTLSLPNDLDARMPSGFTVEADTHYEISVRNGWPMVGSCPIPAST